MTPQQEQLTALAAVFSAAIEVDKLAKTGQMDFSVAQCLMDSLLVINPETTLAVYGNTDRPLSDGFQMLRLFLEKSPNVSKDVLRYALSLLMLERKLNGNKAILSKIAEGLTQLQSKSDLFGITHDNVFAACGSLYGETISKLGHRIQVVGDAAYLQQADNAAKIRSLLLTGIRSAMLWHQTGGRRWHLLFKRKQLIDTLYHRE